MSRLGLLIILGLLLFGRIPARAAAPPSDWPSLGCDAAQSNDNTAEKTLTAHNVLKLAVRPWSIPLPDVSYPVVAGGRVYVPFLTHGHVHVRAYDVTTGKHVTAYSEDALGGLLVDGGDLFVAGHTLQQVDPDSGDALASVPGSSTSSAATFAYPVADRKVILAGYTPGGRNPANSLYAIDPQSVQVLWTAPSLLAQGAIATGRVLTATTSGAAFYSESSGKRMSRQAHVYSEWFAGNGIAYTVASPPKQNATLYAYDTAGHRLWKRTVGPPTAAFGWPHAVAPDAVYVQTLKPKGGVAALDPQTGELLWMRSLADVQRLAVANGLLFVLTYGLGQPVRLVVLKADTGAPIGAVVLSAGYYAFPEPNELMIASGLVFIRVVGPRGGQLVVLGL